MGRSLASLCIPGVAGVARLDRIVLEARVKLDETPARMRDVVDRTGQCSMIKVQSILSLQAINR
jgi:hypothetical protein